MSPTMMQHCTLLSALYYLHIEVEVFKTPVELASGAHNLNFPGFWYHRNSLWKGGKLL